MANPAWFRDDPHLAWGFYGHRLNLYRDTEPHDGFRILRDWGDRMTQGAFVFTSNVDGQFQRAGFDDGRVVECHGSIHHMQCAAGCKGIWDGDGVTVDVDEESFRARPPLPSCPSCGEVARPNILMFGDWGWLGDRTSRQEAELDDWLARVGAGELAVIELGAGTAVPTVRSACERLSGRSGAPLVRVNPREAHGSSGTISIESGALDALRAVDALVST
jgi:NAD-dependent SIR2 family protein deacetylase